MTVDFQGIYHVTFIAGNPQGTIDFYAKVPGLIRASKKPCMYAIPLMRIL
jgi:catechol 2,3-dioxygenase-like lactoylglutathione lyase family enzyme